MMRRPAPFSTEGVPSQQITSAIQSAADGVRPQLRLGIIAAAVVATFLATDRDEDGGRARSPSVATTPSISP